MIRRREPRPIYGIAKRPSACVLKIPEDQNVNVYLQSLQQVLSALEKYNSKTAAIENIQIIENRIDRVLSGDGTNTH
jgi:hypothetical protein